MYFAALGRVGRGSTVAGGAPRVIRRRSDTLDDRADSTLAIQRERAHCLQMSFKDFGLDPEVVRGVESMGYVDPTPIQLRAFPLILEGKDMMGSAQTGTGKTAAFGLPILSLLKSHGK